MRGNPGMIWEEIETKKILFSYNKEQEEKILKMGKLIVYVTEIVQYTLFSDIPPKENCRKVLKDVKKLKRVGFFD